jgi:putative membrane protein
MPWLKLLHVSTVIAWAGALLYLTIAIALAGASAGAAGAAGTSAVRNSHRHTLLRGLFVGVATPAALTAIASGTAIFVMYGPLAPWLIAKLGFVSLLVLGHAACGMLVLRIERRQPAWARSAYVVCAVSLVWFASIAWLVLRKPF